MKLISYFTYFLTNTVNMNQTRLDTLERSVNALYDVLCKKLGDLVKAMDPQGSWAQATIIKPVDGREFDADFMLVIDHRDGWKPSDYLNAVYLALLDSEYAERTTLKHRCVRVAYEGYHVDIVPFVVLPDGRQVIAHVETTDDGDVEEWEDTDPAEFTRWMRDQDDTADGNLRRVIRLMKYLRDHHMHFKRTRSVILTILLGERIDAGKKLGDPGYYADLPTTFVHVLEDLDVWMDANPDLPDLPDPSGADNDFSDRWTQESYDSLRKQVKQLAIDARAAISDELDTIDSKEVWQKIFGDDFKPPPDRGTGVAGGAAGGATVADAIDSPRKSRGG